MGIGIGELLLILFFVAPIFVLIFHSTKIWGKACPNCGEKIKATAKVCRYCHRDVD